MKKPEIYKKLVVWPQEKKVMAENEEGETTWIEAKNLVVRYEYE